MTRRQAAWLALGLCALGSAFAGWSAVARNWPLTAVGVAIAAIGGWAWAGAPRPRL